MKLHLLCIFWVLIFVCCIASESTAAPVYKQNRSIFGGIATQKVSKLRTLRHVKTVRPARGSTVIRDKDTKVSNVFKRLTPVNKEGSIPITRGDDFDFTTFSVKDIRNKAKVDDGRNISEDFDSSKTESNPANATANTPRTSNYNILASNSDLNDESLQLLNILNNYKFSYVPWEPHFANDSKVISESDIESDLDSKNYLTHDAISKFQSKSDDGSPNGEFFSSFVMKNYSNPIKPNNAIQSVINIKKDIEKDEVSNVSKNSMAADPDTNQPSKIHKVEPTVLSYTEPNVPESKITDFLSNANKTVENPNSSPPSDVSLKKRYSSSTTTEIYSSLTPPTAETHEHNSSDESDVVDIISNWYIFSSTSVNYIMGAVALIASIIVMKLCCKSLRNQANQLRRLTSRNLDAPPPQSTEMRTLNPASDDEIEFETRLCYVKSRYETIFI